MPSPESPDRDGGGGPPGEGPGEAFRRLARGLIGVKPSELKEAERRYQESKEVTRVTPRDPSATSS